MMIAWVAIDDEEWLTFVPLCCSRMVPWGAIHVSFVADERAENVAKILSFHYIDKINLRTNTRGVCGGDTDKLAKFTFRRCDGISDDDADEGNVGDEN